MHDKENQTTNISMSNTTAKSPKEKTKRQVLKCVMRRRVNIIYRMMKDKSEYYEKPMPNTQE
jgi:hypothetical protein